MRLMPTALLALLLAAPAAADIDVIREAAEPGIPSPAARTCELRFRDHTPIWTSCTHGCYEEMWDGPVLMAVNTCSDVLFVSHVYAADDGRTWRTPCYELHSGAEPVAIPEPTIGPWAERRVVLVREPGTLGYVQPAPSPTCPETREVQPSTVGQ